jgi:hypothetical protein
MFEHDAPYVAADLLSEDAIKQHIHLHFVGPQGKMDRLIRDTLQTDSLSTFVCEIQPTPTHK